MNTKQFADKTRALAENILQIFLPRRCPVCDTILSEPRELICPDCRKDLPWAARAQARCMKCSRPIEDERAEYCPSCARTEHAFDRAHAVFVYEKGMRKSVLRMKFQNRREYLDFYAKAMAAESRAFLKSSGARAVLPVPMFPRKVRERGYDQCLLLAKKYTALTGLPLITGNLVRVRNTKPQKGLSAGERVTNLRDAFAVCSPRDLPESVLILDDIYTTGSTADEISRVLHASGVKRIFVLALTIAR